MGTTLVPRMALRTSLARSPWPVWFAFALSGAAALLYEVVWTRLLALDTGHGLAAASTVLAAFMGGLAVGSAAGGRLGQQMTRTAALRAYALLEAGIGLFALAMPLLLAGARPVLGALYDDGHGGLAYGTARMIASLALLGLPAAAMGATFPLASRWAGHTPDTMARDAARLYTANTLGATLGAVAAGFLLLPTLGLLGTTAVGVALNLLAALAAWTVATVPADDETVATPASTRSGARAHEASGSHATDTDTIVTAAAVLGLTGWASLTLQVVWTRLLASMLGPTTYAFSAVVALFVAGIALGSAATTRLVTTPARARSVLGVVIGLAALATIGSAAAVDWAILRVATIVATPDITFAQVVWQQWLLTAILLLPLAVMFGAAFPLALALAPRDRASMVKNLGWVYATNTAGAIIGSLLAGFVLIPSIGLFNSLRLIAAVLALTAVALAVTHRTRAASRWTATAVSMLALVGALGLPSWDTSLLSSGAYKYAPVAQGPDVRTALTAGRLTYYREGAAGTVSVRSLTGTRSMAIDGKVDASSAADMLTQRLLAHVPLLLHPNPKTVAVLGLGSGVTLGSALTHGIDRAVVLEISPEVVEASRQFDPENHRALDDPRTRLIVGDGRTHLVLSREQYDVIVSEPSNPWMAGIASLFTREFFAIARARLTPGGVFCQWAHTYDMSDSDLRSIVATFLSEFPEGTAWLVGDGDVLLIGSTAPVVPHLSQMATRWQRPGVADELGSVGIRSPLGVLSLFVAEGTALSTWTAGAPLQTDQRARLEFSGPQSIFGAARPDNAAALRALASATPRPAALQALEAQASGAEWRDVAQMLLAADAFRPAFDLFVRALTLSPTDSAALEGLIRSAVGSARIDEARRRLSELAGVPGNIPARLALSRLAASQGRWNDAGRLAFGAVQEQPGNVDALVQFASILADMSDAERLAPVVARLRGERPSLADTRYYSAMLAYLQQRPDIAAREASAALAADARHARAANILGASLASLRQREQARAAFLKALALDPRAPATYANLATLEHDAGNLDEARRLFVEALTIDPNNDGARQGLAAVTAALP
jgi:spermidine synthase